MVRSPGNRGMGAGYAVRPVRQSRTKTARLATNVVLGLLWTLFSLAWLGVTWLYGGPWYMATPGVLMLPAGLFVLGSGTWALLIRPSLVGRCFGRARAELTPDEVRVGDMVTVRYEQSVRADVDIGRVAVQLVLRETALASSDNGTVAFTRDNIVQEYESPGRRLVPGDVVAEERTFRIPPDSMHGFQGKQNALLWLVRVRVETPAAPDVTEKIGFVVRPE